MGWSRWRWTGPHFSTSCCFSRIIKSSPPASSLPPLHPTTPALFLCKHFLLKHTSATLILSQLLSTHPSGHLSAARATSHPCGSPPCTLQPARCAAHARLRAASQEHRCLPPQERRPNISRCRRYESEHPGRCAGPTTTPASSATGAANPCIHLQSRHLAGPSPFTPLAIALLFPTFKPVPLCSPDNMHWQ